MKKLLIALFAIFSIGGISASAASAPAVYDIEPYAIFDLNDDGQPFAGEYLYPYQQTSHDYNGRVQSQIYVKGYPTANNPYPQVKIGNASGSYIASQAVVNSSNVVVGWLMAFNHYAVTQGYLVSVYSPTNVYDSSAYIK